MSSNNQSVTTVDEQSLLKALLDSSPTAMAYLDPQFNFIQVNHAYAGADGKEPSYFPGKNHFDLYPNKENLQIFQNVVKTGRPFQVQAKPFEYENNRERGVSYWDWSLVPVKDDSGRVTALILSLSDVTERKRAEQSLQEAEAELKHYIDVVPGIIVKANAQTGYFTHCNPALTSILGFSHEEFLARPFMEFVHPDDRQSTIDEVEEQLKGGPVARFENRYICKDGSYKWLEWRATAADEKGIVYAAATDITDRKRAEEELRRYEHIVSSSTDMLALLDEDFVYLAVNEKYAQAFGKPPSELVGATVADVFGEAFFRTMIRPNAEKCLQGNEVRFQNWVDFPSFGKRYMEVTFTPYVGTDNEVRGFAVNGRDITERKQAEDALAQSEERFKKLFQLAPLGYQSLDENGDYLEVNDAWCRTLGYSRDEVIGHNFGEFIDPDFRDIYQRCFPKFKNEGLLEGVELTLIKKDGARIIASFVGRVGYNDDGSFKQTHCIFVDITERKRAEEDLRESEEKYRNLVETSQDLIWKCDAEGKFTYLNHAWEQTLGYKPEEMLGRPFSDFQRPEIYEHDIKEFARHLAGGLVKGYETSHVSKSGDDVHLVFNAIPLFDSDKNIIGTQGTAYDITDRKRAEEELRTSEERFRGIIENTDVGYFFIDQDGIFRDVNSAWVRMHKYSSADEVIGKHFTFSQEVDDVEKAKEFVVGIMAGDTHFLGGEFSRKCKDGSIGYHTFSARSVSRMGKVVGLEGFIIDTTERKLADEALRESEKQLSRIYDTTGDILFYLSVEPNECYRFQSVNQSFLTTTGLKKDQVIGKRIDEIIPSESLRMVLSNYRKAIEKNEIVNWEEVTVFPTGAKTGEVSIAPVFDEFGVCTNLVGSVHDITERKRADEALRASEEKFRTYISHAPDAIFIADPQGRYMDVNEAACRLTGYSREELTSMSITDLTDPEHSSEAQARFENFTDTGSLSTESRFRRKDGTTVSVSLDAVVLSEGLYMAFCSDITETKRLRELESRAQRLETAGQIAGQVAHDFNNLLAPLVAYPEFIRDELGPDHPALPYLDDIENASRQIADINQQLLTLGRRGHYNQEPMNLNEVVSQAIRQMESLPSTLVVASELDDDLMAIKGGKSQVFRAISNLLSNAREAMQDIGQITVRTENFYVDEMWINYARVPQGEYVKLTISDTGCGIPDEIKQKIFEPFFTTKTTDKKRGSGLGISVVDAVIKDHDGHIDVASVMGEGTSFFLYFPVTRESIDSPLHHEIIGGRESILIVDDDSVQRDVCTKLLNSLGYQTTAVGSGEGALKVLADQRYDLLLLDMIMPPGIDGAETFRLTLEINLDQKAIIVSGFAESDRVAAALKMGAGAFVKKPLTRSRLATAVREELDRVVHPA